MKNWKIQDNKEFDDLYNLALLSFWRQLKKEEEYSLNHGIYIFLEISKFGSAIGTRRKK